MKTSVRNIELLAPARDAEIAIEAVKHGADAVYIGAPAHGARVAAGNSFDDIRRVVEYAHNFGVKVYVTVNTIVYDNELEAVERMIAQLYDVGVDALIVQDMGVLRMDLPPIALHASTQCDTRDVAHARFLQDVGFSQIVLARELTLPEISAISDVVDVPLEVFVHGALCVSYSGDCHASMSIKSRSANRGECAQICRLPYDLIDGNGCRLIENKHLLSLRDLNQSSRLEALLDAGVSSFKIEGRLKDVKYVKNTVAYYRKELDRIISANPEKYKRTSFGCSELTFTPELSKSFNRGFTHYFLDGVRPNITMASLNTPKSMGEKVGKVVSVGRNCITANVDVALNNGDGMVALTQNGKVIGFRLNRANGQLLYPAVMPLIGVGDTLYRNSDKMFDDILSQESAYRKIRVDMVLRLLSWGIALDVSDERGNSVTVTMESVVDVAKSPQYDARRRVLGKLGGTIYSLSKVEDKLGNVFIPASQLAVLRRQATELLDQANDMAYVRPLRRREDLKAKFPGNGILTYHENVSNNLAREFYMSHGAVDIEPAIEVSAVKNSSTVVMTTRYCLRREMGRCLKTPGGSEWAGPLTLRSGSICLGLDFDCSECRMMVVNLCNTNKKN